MMITGLGRIAGMALLSATLLIVAMPGAVLAEERTCRGTLGSMPGWQDSGSAPYAVGANARQPFGQRDRPIH